MSSRWWKPIEEAFREVTLSGLTVNCPRCKEKGIVITRWIRGTVQKPIYIMHIKFKKVRKICSLSQEESVNIRRAVRVFESDIKTLLKKRRPFVLFSGGKDSLATLLYLKELTQKVHTKVTAIHVDTTAGLPENMEYVKKVCEYLEVDLQIVRPEMDYFTLAKKWGIPNFQYRWCCRELKIKPIKKFLESVKEPKVIMDGIRAVESSIRRQYIPIWYHPGFKCLSVSPIFYWTDEQVFSFIKNNELPKGLLYSTKTSTECWCGAYKTEEDFRKLYELNKDMFYKLCEVEKENGYRFTYLYKGGQKFPLKNLEEQILSYEKLKHKQDAM